MNAVGHATASRGPETAPARPHPGGDCCTAEVTLDAGLPRFLGGAQARLQVGPPDDAFEREADAVASAIQRGKPVAPARRASATPRFQRLCANCAEKLLEAETAPSDSAGPIRRRTGDPGHSAPAGGDVVSGLPGSLRTRLEDSLGADLGKVQVHTGPTAHGLARQLGARAFTHGQHIWLSARERPEDLGLMAHEVTHVLQQSSATVIARQAPGSTEHRPADDDAQTHTPAIDVQEGGGGDAADGGNTPGSAGDDCGTAGSTDAPGDAGPPVQLHTGPGAPIQRKEEDALDQALSWGAARLDDAGSAVASGTKAAGKFAGDQLMKLLRKVAPQVADIIDEGPLNFATRKINAALDAHLPAALGGFSLGELVDGVSGWLGEAATFAKDLLKGEGKACAAFAGIMEKLTGFVTGLIDNPVVKTFTKTLTKAWDFVGKALKFVAEPVFDNIAKQVSGAWTVLKKVASTVSGWISSAKEALGAAWDTLTETLGFDGSSEDGVWSYIKGVGSDIWEGIKTTMAPVIAPLKKIGGALSLLMPMGQIHAIVKYGPKLVKAAQWVWENGLDPAKIREAPEDIRGMLESLTGGVAGFKGVLQGGLDWMSEKVSTLADGVLDVVGAITGLPLIGYAHDLFDEAKKSLKTLVADIKKGARDALAAIEAAATKIADFLAPYKEVISSLILAIASPVLIPVIFAGWAWRALPACVKIPILNFLLDIAIAALKAIPEVPTFGVLWPLLKPGVMAFLGTLRAASDKVKEQVSDKIAKVISGASPAFLIGFVKGFAVGVWEGITDPFKAIWMVLEGLDSATQYLLSLAGVSEEPPVTKASTPAATPAAPPSPAPAASAAITSRTMAAGSGEIRAATPPASPAPASARKTITAVAPPPAAVSAAPVALAPAVAAASPEAEADYAADPAAALASGAAMPESTRQLLEQLAARQAEQKKNAPLAESAEEPAAAQVEVSAADLPAFKEQVGAVASEIGPDVATVKGGFWSAVEEYFNGNTMSFDDMVTKLSEVWDSAKAKISEGGAWLANKLMSFFRGGGAEGELGDKIGWLTGTITFQILLDAITAGTWIAAGPILKGIAKFINWPMEFLGQAFKLLKKLGKYLLDGLKKLGGVIKDAAAGAFKSVSKALGNIGQRLLSFGEELLGKFGGKAAKAESKAAGALGKEGAQLAEQKAARGALGEAEQKAGRKLETQTAKAEPKPVEPVADKPKAADAKDVETVKPDSPARREASAADSGKLENDKLTPQQTRNESDRFRERPESLEGTAPHRTSTAGKHEWREEILPNGECRFCRYSPTKICVATPELRAGELQKVDEHALALQRQADAQARAAAEAREKALAHKPLSPDETKILDDELAEARKRAEAARKQLGPERGRATRAANSGKADEAAAARKRVERLEADLKRAEEDARTARQMLDEQAQALKKAEELEAAAAAKKEAEAAAQTAADLKAMEKGIADGEARLAAALKQNKHIHTPETLRLQQDLAAQRKALAGKIEASKGLTTEARETLRKGTPFKGAGGAERERAFLESLPPEAKGPNGTYVDYVTGETLPLSNLAVDHVVPVDRIFGMEGFGRLSRADQQAILDMPQNLRFLEQGRNSSKQASSLPEWLGSKTAKAPKLPAAQREALAKVEADARAAIEAEIARRLKKAGVP